MATFRQSGLSPDVSMCVTPECQDSWPVSLFILYNSVHLQSLTLKQQQRQEKLHWTGRTLEQDQAQTREGGVLPADGLMDRGQQKTHTLCNILYWKCRSILWAKGVRGQRAGVKRERKSADNFQSYIFLKILLFICNQIWDLWCIIEESWALEASQKSLKCRQVLVAFRLH